MASDESQHLLHVAPEEIEQRREACVRFRRSTMERAKGSIRRVQGVFSAAKSRVTSNCCVLLALTLVGRVLFLYDLASDVLVAVQLQRHGNPIWGGLVFGAIIAAYVLLVVGLLPCFSRRLNKCGLPLWVARLLWLLFGVPLCLLADLCLNLRYLCVEPKDVQVFHYMTLRQVTEMFEAQLQLLLQGYIMVRQTNPGNLLPSVHGAARVNPLLLGSSVLLSAHSTYTMYMRLYIFAWNQCGGNRLRFLRSMCDLGEGLAPSNLFELVSKREEAVIPYDLRGVNSREMRRLGACIRASRSLKVLIFEDSRWIADLVSLSFPKYQALNIVRDCVSAPKLVQVEFRGEGIPDWVPVGIRNAVAVHRYLKRVEVQGHGWIESNFVQDLPTAHPLQQAVYHGDVAAVVATSTSDPATADVLSDSMGMAATLDDIELLRAVLLLPGGLEAVNVSGGPERGLYWKGNGARPLHFAAAANSEQAVELLLSARADVTVCNSGELTPLHVAARDSCVLALRALVRGGADVDSLGERFATPLLLASQNGCKEAVEDLLALGADASLPTIQGHTPLIRAAQNDNAECLRLLLQARGDLSSADKDGCSAVFVATRNDSRESLSLLLAARADANQAMHNGMTPVVLAARRSHLECLQQLLAARAEAQATWKDKSALQYAQEQEDPELGAALLQAGAAAGAVGAHSP